MQQRSKKRAGETCNREVRDMQHEIRKTYCGSKKNIFRSTFSGRRELTYGM
jgi:hypothetical protein